MFTLLLLACAGGDTISWSDSDPLDTGETGDATDTCADPALTAHVRALVAEHGITPTPPPEPVSPALVDLGQALAFDKLLSGNQDLSCMTCHHSELGTDDDRALPIGVGGAGLGADRTHPHDDRIPRNAPALFNLHTLDTLFWDGRVAGYLDGIDSPADDALSPEIEGALAAGPVAAQALFPVTSADEMRGHDGDNELSALADDDFQGIWDGLMVRILAVPAYPRMFKAAYPGSSSEDWNFGHAANAMAAFEIHSFAATESPWERFLAGDDDALCGDALQGAVVFFEAGCASCHNGVGLSDQSFHNTGLAQFGPGKGHGGDGVQDHGRASESGDDADMYAFRTPPLTNVALTAPYGHLGQHADLESHVRHYVDPESSLRDYEVADHVADAALADTRCDDPDAVLATLDPAMPTLTEDQVEPIVRFLDALTDPGSADLSSTVPASVPSGLPVDD